MIAIPPMRLLMVVSFMRMLKLMVERLVSVE
jgi:hypothetical protein